LQQGKALSFDMLLDMPLAKPGVLPFPA